MPETQNNSKPPVPQAAAVDVFQELKKAEEAAATEEQQVRMHKAHQSVAEANSVIATAESERNNSIEEAKNKRDEVYREKDNELVGVVDARLKEMAKQKAYKTALKAAFAALKAAGQAVVDGIDKIDPGDAAVSEEGATVDKDKASTSGAHQTVELAVQDITRFLTACADAEKKVSDSDAEVAKAKAMEKAAGTKRDGAKKQAECDYGLAEMTAKATALEKISAQRKKIADAWRAL